MDIRQFRAEVAQAFEEVGLERRTIPRGKDPIWVLPGREIERSFSQHAMRRLGAFVLSGVLSINVPAFRAWLAEQFPEDQLGILCNSLLSRHIGYELEEFYEVQDYLPIASGQSNQSPAIRDAQHHRGITAGRKTTSASLEALLGRVHGTQGLELLQGMGGRSRAKQPTPLSTTRWSNRGRSR